MPDLQSRTGVRLMPCHGFNKDGVSGIYCTGRKGRKKCAACGTQWASLECDFPDQNRKSGTCDKPLCNGCAVTVGPDRDFCPHHPRDVAPGPAQTAMEGL
jgi:hypothetical protein